MEPAVLPNTSVAEENFTAYTRFRDAGHTEWLKEATRFDEFYRGKQWREADVQRLAEVKRPALTFNRIKPAIGVYLGEHIGRQTMFTFKPRSAATAEGAHALTQTVMNIQATNNYQFVEQEVLADGLIMDRGFFDVRLDFTDHLMGEVRIVSKDPATILIDPDATSYDPDTWSGFIETRWLTLDEVELFHGKDKADTVRAFAESGTTFGTDSVYGDTKPHTFSEGASALMAVSDDKPEVKKVRVIDRQYRKLSMQKFFVTPNGDLRPVPDTWDAKRVAAMKQAYGLKTIKRLARRIRWTVTADNVVLHDEWSPYSSFTLLGYFPYWRRGAPTGAVRDLVDPQEMHNKATSQELHVINTTANSGWLVEEGSLANMQPEDLEERGAETGLVVTYRRGRPMPEKIKPNTVPTGLENLSAKGSVAIAEISGTAPLMGLDSPEVSGVALEQRQGRALVPMRVPQANMDRTRNLLAKRVLSIIQMYYTESRIVRVYDENGAPTDETMMLNGIDPVLGTVNDVTSGEYDVVISSMPARETFEDIQFAEALQLREVGVTMPDDVIIKMSHLREREQIAERVRALIGQAEPTEQEMQVAQLQAQLQMQAAMLQLKELEAKIEKLMSETQLNAVKAQTTMAETEIRGSEAALARQAHLEKMRVDVVKHMSDLKNKLDLAELHSNAKTGLTQYTTASKSLDNEMKLATQTQIAREQMQSQQAIAKSNAKKPQPTKKR